jgi:hypothetical protein
METLVHVRFAEALAIARLHPIGAQGSRSASSRTVSALPIRERPVPAYSEILPAALGDDAGIVGAIARSL